MQRRRHISSGSPQNKSLADNGHPSFGQGDFEPRNRSTSWGARDRLRMQKELKISGGNGYQAVGCTPMSQLIGRKLSLVEKNPSSHDPEHQFTGKALIWQRSASVDESGYRHKTVDADMSEMEIEDLEVNDPLVFNKFMRAHKCYDLIPTSAKLVVFDTQLSVKKAFYALVYNSVRSAPLWDSASQDFIGMLTITDFIMILTKYYRSPQKVHELEEQKIIAWREQLQQHNQPFFHISPDASLHDATRLLIRSKVHRLPVIDPITGNALFIITHKRILKFLHLFMRHLPKPPYMNDSIADLNLGTYNNIATVTLETKLVDALALFINRRVSALPVIDSGNEVVNVYAKFDVINLASDKSYHDLECPISEALGYRKGGQENIHSCQSTDSLSTVIDKIVKAEVHRLIVMDTSHRLVGVISLSDILKFLLHEDSSLVSRSRSCSATLMEDKMEMFPEPLEAI